MDTEIQKKKEVTKDLSPAIQRRKPVGVVGPQYGHNKRKRTKEDFLNFCKVVLKYTEYEPDEKDFKRNSVSPPNSTGSATDFALADDSPNETGKSGSGSEDEGKQMITCFCKKPFAGRPMIECGSCETWIHLSCAKIRRTNIPEEYICQKCREANNTARKSNRVRTESKRLKNT